jgi:hypothetical protein
LFPVAAKKATAAAKGAGLTAAGISALHVEGDNRAGAGAAITRALADAGVNLDFLVAPGSGRNFSVVLGFDNDADADKATALIKKALAKKK